MTTPKLNIINIKKYLKDQGITDIKENFHHDVWSMITLRNNRQEICNHFGIIIDVDDHSTDCEQWISLAVGTTLPIVFGGIEQLRWISVNINNEFEPYCEDVNDLLEELQKIKKESETIWEFLSSKLS